jgi:hypothetical protein
MQARGSDVHTAKIAYVLVSPGCYVPRLAMMTAHVEVVATGAPSIRSKTRPWLLAAGALVMLGAVLRLWGYFEYEFWYDEAFWASRTLRSVSNPTRPIGYMFLSQALAKLHNTEALIRLPSLLAGIASMPLLLKACRASGLSWPVSLLGLFALSIHPWAVTASKEFKPYALEFALHLGLLALFATYVNSRKTRDLVLLLCLCAISTGFAWTVAMLFPWLFLSLLALTWQNRNKLHALLTVSGGAVSAACLGAIFLFRLKGTSEQRDPTHFGAKYDVFYMGDGGVLDHALWLLRNTAEVAAFPARLGPFLERGPGAQAAFEWLHASACLAGCAYLVKKRAFFSLAAWLGTWLTAIGLATARVWPYGVFRTNLYLLAYTFLFVLCGVQLAWEWARERNLASKLALGLALAYVALVFPYRLSKAAEKTAGGATASVRKSLETIKAYEAAAAPWEGRGPLLILDGLSCAPFKYYTRDHATARGELRDFFRKRMKSECMGRGTKRLRYRVNRSLKRGFWLIVSKATYIEPMAEYVRERCTPDVLQNLPGPTLLAHCAPQPD